MESISKTAVLNRYTEIHFFSEKTKSRRRLKNTLKAFEDFKNKQQKCMK